MKLALSAGPRRTLLEPGPGNQYETGCSKAAVKPAESPGLTSPTLIDHKLAVQVPGATSAWKGNRGGKAAVETADQSEVGVREALEEGQAACRDPARLRDVYEIAELA